MVVLVYQPKSLVQESLPHHEQSILSDSMRRHDRTPMLVTLLVSLSFMFPTRI